MRADVRAIAALVWSSALAACSGASDARDFGAPSPRDGGVLARDAVVVEPGTDASATNPDATSPRPDAGLASADAEATDDGVFRPFAASSPWNTPIPADPPLDPDNTALIADLATSSAQFPFIGIMQREWTVPVYFVAPGDPVVEVTIGRVAGEGFNPGPVRLPIPANARPDPRSDAHMSIIDLAAGQEYGFFGAARTPSGFSCRVCAMARLDGSGVRPVQDEQQPWWMSHGPRACGFPTIAGLIRPDEIRAGRIDHALVIAYPHIRSRWYTPPASTSQGRIAGQAEPDRGIPCGGRVQLDPSIDVTRLGLSRGGVIVARALQEYGAFVGDYAGAINLYADGSDEAQAAWATNILPAYDLRNRVDLRSFRVLALGTLYDGRN